ncbi:MAG: 16S rRNA (adenine(1518)-N(6)/adenine(1519)-N(6))-dimethyltransferase RsmA [Bacteroidales bacterium]|nr:16S rRNA (adenine(1518)-N(6)/adenine(1519)-N(6))-dimethyltransferase RsmA [Bacteroidales bacterium]
MKVRAKKSLGQHFLTDLSVAQRIAASLVVGDTPAVLEVGPGTGVLTQYLLQRDDINLKMVELDREAVNYLLTTFPQVNGSLIEADFLHLRLENLFAGNFCIIGNFPYNISSQIFFKVLDYRDRIPQVVCMIQKEVAERIAEKPGSKTYGILSVLLQAWYDIEYLFSVGPNSFRPAPKVNSAVIRLTRNARTELGCDERLFKAVVKTAFNQRRKTLRNSLKSMILEKVAGAAHVSVGSVGSPSETVNPTPAGASDETFINVSESALAEAFNQFTADPIFDLRPEKLSVEDFISLTLRLTQ